MKLQILVPQYKETEQVISGLLNSIQMQQGIDLNEVGVIIVNDGSNVKLDQSFLESYNFSIAYHNAEHNGVSATRNKLLDLATSDYIMYCDADDIFSCSYGIWMIFREMQIGEFDCLVSKFVEETFTKDTQEITYIYHDNDAVFVHGKVYRRQYLIENNIRWNEDLTIHEDSFFNIIAQTVSKDRSKVKYIDNPFYLWRWNSNSVCRNRIQDYMIVTYNNLIDSNDALIDELRRRGFNDQADSYVCSRILETYYTLNKAEWLDPQYADYRQKTEKRLYEFLAKHVDAWNRQSLESKMNMSNQLRARIIEKGMGMESFTFDSWIKNLLDTYGQ